MEKTEKKGNDSEVSDILGTLADLDRGNFVILAGRRLLELTKACADVRAKGSLTIKLKLTPVGRSEATGKVNQFEIKPEISIDKPEHPLRPSLFFATEDARFTRNDPDQESLFEEDERKVNVRN